MKNFVKLIAVFMSVLIFGACTKSDSPEVVMENFLKYLQKKKFAEAKELGTEATAQILDMMEGFTKMGGEEAQEEGQESEIEDLKCEINGETATCTCIEDGEQRQFELVKQGGKWLVDIRIDMPTMNEEDMELQELEEMGMEKMHSDTLIH